MRKVAETQAAHIARRFARRAVTKCFDGWVKAHHVPGAAAAAAAQLRHQRDAAAAAAQCIAGRCG